MRTVEAGVDCCPDDGPNGALPVVWINYLGDDLAMGLIIGAAQHAHDDLFAGLARLVRDRLGATALVHVDGLAAHIGFIGLKLATGRLDKRAGLHRETDAVEHEPSRLPRDTDRAVDFIRRHAVSTVGDRPNGHELLVERQGAILEHRATLAENCFLGWTSLHSHIRCVLMK